MNKKSRENFQVHPTIEPHSPIPLHHQISKGIMRELLQYHVPAGTPITSILQLATRLHLNRDTVRKAYSTLEQDKVIRRTPGGRIIEVAPEFVQRNAQTALLTIGIVLPTRMHDLLTPASAPALSVVSGIMDEAAERGVAAMIVPLPTDESQIDRLRDWLNNMLSKLNGLVYLGEDKDSSHLKAFEILLNNKLPQVFISGHPFVEQLGIVQVDLAAAFAAEVDYLWQLGHRRFAVCGRQIPKREFFQLQTYDRIPELCQAVRNRTGLPEQWIFTGDLDYWPVRPWLKQLLRASERPSAILCADDREAQMVVLELRDLGQEIPRDISVFGYGDTAKLPGLGISSVQHPWFQTGCAAVEMIDESWRRTIPVNQLTKRLKAPLVIRGSTGPAPNFY